MILCALSVKIRGRQSACEPGALALHTLQGYIDCGGLTAICQRKQFFPGVCTFQPCKGLLCPLAELDFITCWHLPENDFAHGLKMLDYLCSHESTKGFDDFSYSLFAFLTFSHSQRSRTALPAVGQENGCRTSQPCYTLPALRFVGDTGSISSEAAGSGLTLSRSPT